MGSHPPGVEGCLHLGQEPCLHQPERCAPGARQLGGLVSAAWPAPAAFLSPHSQLTFLEGLSAWMLLSLVMICENSLLKCHKAIVSPKSKALPAAGLLTNTVGQGSAHLTSLHMLQ